MTTEITKILSGFKQFSENPYQDSINFLKEYIEVEPSSEAYFELGKALFLNGDYDESIQYLEKPMSYENKKETSFKVLQVLGNAALATEASDKIGGDVMYYGNTVLILGENYYSDQIVTVKNPQRVGTYSYTTNGGMPKTVPVIDGEMK